MCNEDDDDNNNNNDNDDDDNDDDYTSKSLSPEASAISRIQSSSHIMKS
jgi:hypothetical protein